MEGLKNQSWNRRLYDGCKTTDDMRLSTGPGRYQLDAPPQYCNACFAPEPTIRQQKWGASQNSSYQKTDVESDLLNLNRQPTKNTCSNQYNPSKDSINKGGLTNSQECSFPQVHSRLVDPPCTLRSSGWNRWEWLCDNPQEATMIPFDNMITTRLQQKDQFRPCIPIPIESTTLLPEPSAKDNGVNGSPFDGLSTDSLADFRASIRRSVSQYPRGEDFLPEAPTSLYGIQPAPVNPPSVSLGKYDVASKL